MNKQQIDALIEYIDAAIFDARHSGLMTIVKIDAESKLRAELRQVLHMGPSDEPVPAAPRRQRRQPWSIQRWLRRSPR